MLAQAAHGEHGLIAFRSGLLLGVKDEGVVASGKLGRKKSFAGSVGELFNSPLHPQPSIWNAFLAGNSAEKNEPDMAKPYQPLLFMRWVMRANVLV